MNTQFHIKSRIQQGVIGVLAGIFLLGTVISLAKPAWSNAPSGIAAMLQERKINTFEDYLGWINGHMKYQAGHFDDWNAPENTMLLGYGNCADLAFLHQAALRYFGYESKTLAIGKGSIAHVFTLFKKDGRLYMFDNLKLRTFNTPSADQAVRNLFTQFDASFLLQLNGELKSVKILYSKNHLPLKFRIKNLHVT
jgi:hypothetical protein